MFDPLPPTTSHFSVVRWVLSGDGGDGDVRPSALPELNIGRGYEGSWEVESMQCTMATDPII